MALRRPPAGPEERRPDLNDRLLLAGQWPAVPAGGTTAPAQDSGPAPGTFPPATAHLPAMGPDRVRQHAVHRDAIQAGENQPVRLRHDLRRSRGVQRPARAAVWTRRSWASGVACRPPDRGGHIHRGTGTVDDSRIAFRKYHQDISVVSQAAAAVK